jgi:antitoxin ParD1/3/4
MNLEITPELDDMVQRILRTGRYESESEVLHEALSLLRQRDELRQEIKKGIAEIDRGEHIEGEDVFQELEARAVELSKANG